MMRSRLHLLVVPIAALIAILPLLIDGCSCGHDLDFHLISWLEAARQISGGDLHPHWAYTPAFGAGEPRFVFYPPLSWTIGALLTLALQHLPSATSGQAFAYVPILYTWVALCSAGLAVHTLVRRYTTANAAVLAAALYVANPYTLFTAYERSAYAELLAATWLPLLLLAILPSLDPLPLKTSPPTHTLDTPQPDPNTPLSQPVPHPAARISVPLLALTVALLWLTNAPAAVMGCYALALLAAVRLPLLYRESRSLRPPLQLAAQYLAGASLGLALAAFYIVPAAYQRRWVQISMAVIPSLRIVDNTLFHHTGDPFHDAVLHTASVIALLLLVLTGAALLAAWIAAGAAARLATTRRSSPNLTPAAPPQLIPPNQLAPATKPDQSDPARRSSPPDPRTLTLLSLLAILTGVIALLLTPFALPVWQHAPELAFLQFPWRLLAILVPALALALALALRSVNLRSPFVLIAALILPAALTFGAYRSFRQVCDYNETPQAQLALFHSGAGTEPTDEYTPITADNDALKPGNPPIRLLSDGQIPNVHNPPSPPLTHFDLDLRDPAQLVLDLRDYPAWSVRQNGVLIVDRLPRDDGLIAFNLPPGPSHLSIAYTATGDQIAGDAISIIALCIFVPLAFRSALRRGRAPAGLTPPTL